MATPQQIAEARRIAASKLSNLGPTQNSANAINELYAPPAATVGGSPDLSKVYEHPEVVEQPNIPPSKKEEIIDLPNLAPAPSGSIGSSTTVQRGVTGPDITQARSELGEASYLRSDAVDKSVQAQLEQNRVFQESARQKAEIQAETARKAQELEQRKAQAADAAIKDITMQSQRVQELSAIDPNHFYASKGTGDKIAMALGIALSQFGSRGGPNQVLSFINSQIDRDIDAQKSAYDRARGSLDIANNLYNMNVKRYGDQLQGTLATRALLLDAAAAKQDQLVAGVQDKNILAKAQDMKGMLLQESAKAKMALAELAGTKSSTTSSSSTQTGGMQGLGGANSELFVPTGKNGEGYLAPSSAEASKARDEMADVQALKGIIDRLKVARSETGAGGRFFGNIFGIGQAELRGLQAQAVARIRNLEDAKRINPTTATDMEKQLGDFTTALGHPEKRADALMKTLDDAIQARKGGSGGNEARDVKVRGKGGVIQDLILKTGESGGPLAKPPSGFKVEE